MEYLTKYTKLQSREKQAQITFSTFHAMSMAPTISKSTMRRLKQHKSQITHRIWKEVVVKVKNKNIENAKYGRDKMINPLQIMIANKLYKDMMVDRNANSIVPANNSSNISTQGSSTKDFRNSAMKRNVSFNIVIIVF